MDQTKEMQAYRKKLDCLNKATVSYEYLHSNSTTHEFVFGAMAELVDNSRDADATSLHIDFDKRRGTLSFLDDGIGMTPDETTDVVCFGHSKKRMEIDKIGQYGNGLKSGAMRIANDFMIFTKKDTYCTALLLSRTFHEASGVKDILVPAPVFSKDLDAITDNPTKHKMEIDLIYRYSPFKTLNDLKEQFDKIDEDHGTMIVLFNLRRIENGSFELNFNDNPHDIGLSDSVDERENEKNSLRAYLSVLYLRPYTKIYLRGKKVNTIRIQNTLALVSTYDYFAKNLKACAEKEVKLCNRRAEQVRNELAMMSSEYGELMQRSREKEAAGGHFDKEDIVQQRRLNMKIDQKRELLKECQKKVDKANEMKKKPSPLKFTFGLNIHHRNKYGCMIYNNGRLIEMYVKLPVQEESNDAFMRCLGVIALVDIPYSVLEPTHNKQSFEDKKEFQSVLRAMNNHMYSYWEDIVSFIGESGVKKLWSTFGYEDCSYSSEVNRNFELKKERYKKTGHCIQCDDCLKWRVIPFNEDYVLDGVPEDWTCSMNPRDSRGCDVPERTNQLENGKPGALRPAGFETRKSLLALSQPDPVRSLFEKWSSRKPFTYEPMKKKPLIPTRERETPSSVHEDFTEETEEEPPLFEPKKEVEDEGYYRQTRSPLRTMSARKGGRVVQLFRGPSPEKEQPKRPLATMSARKKDRVTTPGLTAPADDRPRSPLRTMSARKGGRVVQLFRGPSPEKEKPRRVLGTMSARKGGRVVQLFRGPSPVDEKPRRPLATMSARKQRNDGDDEVPAWFAALMNPTSASTGRLRRDSEGEDHKDDRKKQPEKRKNDGLSPENVSSVPQKKHPRDVGYLASSSSDSDSDKIEQKVVSFSSFILRFQYQPTEREKRKAARETRKATGMGDTLQKIGKFVLSSSESEDERETPEPSSSQEKPKLTVVPKEQEELRQFWKKQDSFEKKKKRIEETPSPVIQKNNVSDRDQEEAAERKAELERIRKEIAELNAELEKSTNENEKMKEELSKLEQESLNVTPHFTQTYPTEENLRRDVMKFLEWIKETGGLELSKEINGSTAYSLMHEVATAVRATVESDEPEDPPEAEV